MLLPPKLQRRGLVFLVNWLLWRVYDVGYYGACMMVIVQRKEWITLVHIWVMRACANLGWDGWTNFTPVGNSAMVWDPFRNELGTVTLFLLHIFSMISFGGFLAECIPCYNSSTWKLCPTPKIWLEWTFWLPLKELASARPAKLSLESSPQKGIFLRKEFVPARPAK